MSDAGKLAYKRNDDRLAYKKAGNDAGSLIFKADLGMETTITFAWGSNGKDLDICAFWDDAPEMKVGYGYLVGGNHSSGAYHISHSGDMQGVDDSEWVKIIKRPLAGAPSSFTIWLNFWGYDSEDYPAHTCSVIASQANGKTKVLNDVPCGTSRRSPATGSPGVRVTFDSSGFIENIVPI